VGARLGCPRMGMVTKTIRIRGDRGARAVEASSIPKSRIRRDVARRVGRLLTSHARRR